MTSPASTLVGAERRCRGGVDGDQDATSGLSGSPTDASAATRRHAGVLSASSTRGWSATPRPARPGPDQAGTRNGSQLSRGWPGGRPAVGPRPYGQGTGTGGESLRESEQRRVVGAVRGATV